nr:helix-turn-helix domain-containing protein [Bradyrhizobium retamae]
MENYPVNREPRSGCPIASTLDIVGDRWTLVILRDLLNGKSRFSQFFSSPEKITTNILTDRLAKMESAGLVTKSAYQERPTRFEYTLTRKGEALLPVLHEMCHWANVHIPGTWTPPASFMAQKPG